MNGKNPCKDLALWLRNQLESGITVGDDVLDFMEATFGTNQLEDIWSCAGNSETDSLMELIFYPDRSLQTRFEAQWGHVVFSSADQQAVIAQLTATQPSAVLSVAGNAVPLRWTVPDFALEAFVQRLNISWQPASELNQVLQRHLAREQRIAARVLLRHAPMTWHNHHVRLAVHFFRRMPAEARDYAPCLEFLLSILPEFGTDQDPYTFLVSKKSFYFQSLCKAEDFENRRRKTNMEILMMQGERAAHGSMEQWRDWMRMIDRICLVLFERTEFFHQPMEHSIDLQPNGASPGDPIQSVIRMLS